MEAVSVVWNIVWILRWGGQEEGQGHVFRRLTYVVVEVDLSMRTVPSDWNVRRARNIW